MPANTYGRQVVLILTNRSGASVAAGDVVVFDTTGDESFTTTITGRAELSVGIAQETIASLALGRVLVSGYAALVNVPASVTRGHYIETHTVVKQATGSATRRSGSMGQFAKTSTTPSAWLWGQTDQTAAGGGSVATDVIWDVAGDLVQGTGADTAARLALGAVGTVVRSTGATNAYAYPPGYEFNYVENVAGTLSVTATTEATSQIIVTGSSVTYDGSTAVIIQAFSPLWSATATAGDIIVAVLWDDTAGASLGKLALKKAAAAALTYDPLNADRRLTPTAAARTYSIRAYVSAGTGEVFRGAGGVGNYMPAFIRITKV